MAGGKGTWEKQRAALRKIQMAFDLSGAVQKSIKREALEADLSPSDMVRRILGLEVASRKIRERISFSLTDEEMAVLAQRFGLDLEKRADLRKQIAEALVDYVETQCAEARHGNAENSRID
jgi:hypothetical protein